MHAKVLEDIRAMGPFSKGDGWNSYALAICDANVADLAEYISRYGLFRIEITFVESLMKFDGTIYLRLTLQFEELPSLIHGLHEWLHDEDGYVCTEQRANGWRVKIVRQCDDCSVKNTGRAQMSEVPLEVEAVQSMERCL